MLVGDWTSNRWVTCFSEVAENLLGKTSQEIGELLEHDKEAADAIFNEVAFQQKVFKMRSKVETYQVSLMLHLKFERNNLLISSSGCSKEQDYCLSDHRTELQGIQQVSHG